MDPYQRLWTAVLQQAIDDSVAFPSPYKNRKTALELLDAKRDARHFLRGEGTRKADRSLALSGANIDPDAFDDYLRKELLPAWFPHLRKVA